MELSYRTSDTIIFKPEEETLISRRICDPSGRLEETTFGDDLWQVILTFVKAVYNKNPFLSDENGPQYNVMMGICDIFSETEAGLLLREYLIRTTDIPSEEYEEVRGLFKKITAEKKMNRGNKRSLQSDTRKVSKKQNVHIESSTMEQVGSVSYSLDHEFLSKDIKALETSYKKSTSECFQTKNSGRYVVNRKPCEKSILVLNLFFIDGYSETVKQVRRAFLCNHDNVERILNCVEDRNVIYTTTIFYRDTIAAAMKENRISNYDIDKMFHQIFDGLDYLK